MLNDFDMIKHSFDKDITIYPIADVHLGAMELNEAAWQEFIKMVQTTGAKVIFVGDLLNNSTRHTKFANPFEEAIRPRDAKRRMVEYLEPIRGQILCGVSGNHERRTYRDDDQDITYDIFSKLDIEHLYRENIAFVKIGLGKRKSVKSKYMASYTFAVTHGSGGGIYTGASVNRNERFGNVIDGIDCLVVGHSHKPFVTRPSKISVDTQNEAVRMKDYTVISCVSWLNYGGYAARSMLLPAQACKPQAIYLAAKKEKSLTTKW